MGIKSCLWVYFIWWVVWLIRIVDIGIFVFFRKLMYIGICCNFKIVICDILEYWVF